jgi:hypothetical protein
VTVTSHNDPAYTREIELLTGVPLRYLLFLPVMAK